MTQSSLAPSWPHLFIAGSGLTVITLHGFGGNESEVSALGRWLDPSATLVSPRGPKTLEGAHYWYGTLGATGFIPDDTKTRASALRDFLIEAGNHYGFDIRSSIIAGFSNGAAMALALAVYFPQDVLRVAAFSGTLPFEQEPEGDLTETKIWYSHGDNDPWVSQEASRFAAQSLRSMGAEVQSLERPGGHTISEEEIRGAQNYFLNMFNERGDGGI